MKVKPRITIVGPGRLGGSVALALRGAGYSVGEIISLRSRASRKRAKDLARRLGGRATTADNARLDAEVIWFCVPDRKIAGAAGGLAKATSWKGKVALHSSGALGSDELEILRKRGASIASVHPMMTFVPGAMPSLAGVPFALEGDRAGVSVGRRIVRDLGGNSFAISKNGKAAYHAWGGFLSPLLVLMLVAGEKVAGLAGLSTRESRKKMMPILRQTLANYAKLGPARAFSGPIGRGDTTTVRKHLQVLKNIPNAREVYLALARVALRHIPVHNRKELRKVLSRKRS